MGKKPSPLIFEAKKIVFMYNKMSKYALNCILFFKIFHIFETIYICIVNIQLLKSSIKEKKLQKIKYYYPYIKT